MKWIILTTLLILSSCKQKEMEIIPIVDDYAIINGGVPVQDIFLIKNFVDNKQSIIKVLNYIQTEICQNLPYGNNLVGDFTFLFDKSHVTFEDGYAIANADFYLYFVMAGAKYNYYRALHINKDYTPRKFVINDREVTMEYDELNWEVLHQFMKICNDEFWSHGGLNYTLHSTSDETVESTIDYQNYDSEAYDLNVIP